MKTTLQHSFLTGNVIATQAQVHIKLICHLSHHFQGKFHGKEKFFILMMSNHLSLSQYYKTYHSTAKCCSIVESAKKKSHCFEKQGTTE